MSRMIDISNQRFGRLVAFQPSTALATNKSKKWICKCDCGTTKEIRSSDLRFGKVTSCGCRKDEKTSERFKKHGMSGTLIYDVWRSIKQRCYNPRNKDFPNYGGRGILMDPQWKEDFTTFHHWAVSNGYREGLTIERVDPNGNYEPSNCSWIENEEQANNRRNSIRYEYQGQSLTIRELSEKLNMNYNTLRDYLRNKKMSVEEVINKKHKQKRMINNDRIFTRF